MPATTRRAVTIAAGAAAAGLTQLGSVASAEARSERMRMVANGLRPKLEIEGEPPTRWPLTERMAQWRVPGACIAVIESGEIAWAHGWGVLTEGGAEVTRSTLFQACSITKVITATATLRLAERGVLDLDADVNRYLRSWRVPENEFTAQEKVTLRRILSHTAGLTTWGFPGYRADGPMPTVFQVLNGEPPASTGAVRVFATPGSVMRYSGGGVTIEQVLLSDVVGRAFPDIVQTLVLDPLDMDDSTFNHPLSHRDRARAARGHDAEGAMTPGGWNVGPELGAAWVWSTPSDLARWALGIDRARRGVRGAVLGQAMAEEMLTLQPNSSCGLGPFLEGEGVAFRYAHGGANTGYRCHLVYFPATGQGAAVMVNGDGGDPLLDEILSAIAGEYQWPAMQSQTLATRPIGPDDFAALVGDYVVLISVMPSPIDARLEQSNGRLVFTANGYFSQDPVVMLTDGSFASPQAGYRFTPVRDANGAITELAFVHNGLNFVARRR